MHTLVSYEIYLCYATHLGTLQSSEEDSLPRGLYVINVIHYTYYVYSFEHRRLASWLSRGPVRHLLNAIIMEAALLDVQRESPGAGK